MPIVQTLAYHGIDLVVHSATKAIGDHADFMDGVIAAPTRMIEQISERAHIGRLAGARRSASLGGPATLVVRPAAMWAGLSERGAGRAQPGLDRRRSGGGGYARRRSARHRRNAQDMIRHATTPSRVFRILD